MLFANDLPAYYQPDVFWNNIPTWITYSENGLRIFIFGLPFIMMLSKKSRIEKMGFVAYWVGSTIYYLSWVAMMYYPESNWSKSAIGFTAPAYTTIIWLIGIGWIGNTSFLKIRRLWDLYLFVSFVCDSTHLSCIFCVFEKCDIDAR